MTLRDILSAIVVFQLLLLAVFLFTHKKGKRISNLLLGGFFLSLCLNFTDGVLIFNNAYHDFPELAFIGNNFSLLFGPLLYLYTRSVIYQDFQLRSAVLWHAVPFLLFQLFAIFTYHLQPDDMKHFILDAAGKQQIPAVVYVLGSLLYIQFYAYAFAALRQVSKYKIEISNRFSEINRINLNWLRSTLVLFMTVIGIGLLNSFISLTPLTRYFSITLTVIIITIFIFVSQVLLRALHQPTIFEGIREEDSADMPAVPVTPIQVSSRPADWVSSHDEKEDLKSKITAYMETKKPFLEPQLTLEQLAQKLSMKPRILSQIVNECLHQNFFEFVNRYRIEEAKRILSDPRDKKITVLEVLYQVGFSSKSSFNTLFKKYTGVTPRQFKSDKGHD